jgi:hypothetical protein
VLTRTIRSHDVKGICAAWKAVLSTRSALGSWHEGIDKHALVTALLDIHNKVHFRCRVCHDKEPHVKYMLFPQDLAVQGAQHNPIIIE